MKRTLYLALAIAPFAAAMTAPLASTSLQNRGADFRDEFGITRTVSSAGFIDTSGPFFQSLGTNGRSCATCHVASQNWTVSADDVQRRFDATEGRDPIFRPVDGSNSPDADVSSVQARRRAYSMLRNKGVIRIERPIPTNAEFELVGVNDPYHYASAAGLSLFRRPLPATNLRFISTVMWDGREVDPNNPMKIANTAEQNHDILVASLEHQALDATSGHAQGNVPLTPVQQQQIADFELGLSSAQILDFDFGILEHGGALGGPLNIQSFPFYIGINDNVNDPAGPFNPNSMTLFSSWLGAHDDRAAVARGEALFNSKQIKITGVAGLNDNAYFGSPAVVNGTCTTCHNAPQIGDHSLAIALNIGIADGSRRTSDMPLYTLRNIATGQVIKTTDPGLALSTGRWNDIGRFKGPVLRGLAARAPYFHNGSAADLGAVLDFYTDRFGVKFTARERADLIAFLRSL